MEKKEEGITLISLTITIIIMIILSAILISATNGIGDAEESLNYVEKKYEQNKIETEHKKQSIEEKWGNVIYKNTIDNVINLTNTLN